MPQAPSELNKHFTKCESVPGALNHVICNHCQDETQKVDMKSLIRKKKHLRKCRRYQIWLRTHPEDVDSEDELLDDGLLDDIQSYSVAKNSNGKRPRSEARTVTIETQHRAAALAIYAGGHPITLFDPLYHPEMVEFIQSFDPTFEGIDKRTIALLIGECALEEPKRPPTVNYTSYLRSMYVPEDADVDSEGLYSRGASSGPSYRR